MNEWISIKDRLPDNMATVLVNYKGIFQDIIICFYNAGNFYKNSFSDDDLTKYITHWQPLPKPPESHE